MCESWTEDWWLPGETGVLGRVLALDKVRNLNAMCVVGEGWVPGEVGTPGGALKTLGQS